MTPEELVGRRIREARVVSGMTQRELGEALQGWLGSPLHAQAISVAEQGGRKFDPTELLAFASVLERPVPWFFTPDDPSDAIEFPGTQELAGLMLLQMLSIEEGEFAVLSKVRTRLHELIQRADVIEKELDLLRSARHERVED